MNRISRSVFSTRQTTVLVLGWLAAAFAVPMGTAVAQDICPERYHVEVDGKRLSLPYCTTAPIDQRNENIQRIVFSIHGVGTNATTYFRHMVRAAEEVPGALERTLIIAPKLMTRSFANDADIGPTDVFWNTSSQRFWGGQSGSSEQHPREVSISSFEIMDRLLMDLTDPNLFPNLEIIVLAGHSGGGQFTNRYAVSSTFHGNPARQQNVHIRYIVAQPSTHVYLSNERVDPESRTRVRFQVPPAEAIEDCPRYDNYGAGFQGLDNWPYLQAVDIEQMRRQYAPRDVVYLHGMNDNDPRASALARGCSAMLQGAHRLERGITYFNFIEYFYDGEHNHRISFVPRVGHSAGRMWISDQGLLHIFDHAVTLIER